MAKPETYAFLPTGKKLNTPTLQEFSFEDAKILLERTDNFFALNKPEEIRLGRRPIEKNHVANLLGSMMNNEWNIAVPAPIVISASKGILIEGNHRMTALAQTDLSFIFVVSYVDLENERDVALKIDTAKKRTGSTALIIAGLSAKKTMKMMSLIRLLYFMAGHPSSKTINNYEYVQIFEKYSDQLLAYVNNWGENDKVLPKRFVYALDFVLREFMHEPLADQIRDSVEGKYPIAKGADPIWQVRQQLFDSKKEPVKFNDGQAIFTLMDAYKRLKAGMMFSDLKMFQSYKNNAPYFDGFDLDILKGHVHKPAKKKAA